MKIISLFSGCGGLDLGFKKAGYDIVFANEYDKDIHSTYMFNSPNTYLDKRDIRIIPNDEIPNADGIIGGPPCQSWSEAGAGRGINDKRGQLFYEYIRILKNKQPLFFLAENVSGMLSKKHEEAFNNILTMFDQSGYNVSFELLNAKYFNVPQDRKRVIFVGLRKDLKFQFQFPLKNENLITLKDSIWDLKDNAISSNYNQSNLNNCLIPNHEYLVMGYSSMYMSRNRVRKWDEQSYTIQAGGRHAPIHPQANKMIKINNNKFIFDENSIDKYRRLSVRECARIQTFPDDFIFVYNKIISGYKMVGNAVPVQLSFTLASEIYKQLVSIGAIYEQPA